MKNKIQEGGKIDIVAPSGGLTSGQGVLIGAGLFGVASTDIAEGETGVIDTEGVFELPKVAGALSAGDIVRWNTSSDQVTETVSTFKQIGVVVEDAASGAATCKVKLVPGLLIGSIALDQIDQGGATDTQALKWDDTGGVWAPDDDAVA